jgi:hypothetical protein
VLAGWGAEAEASYNETEFQHRTVGDTLLHGCLTEVRLAKPVLNGSYQIEFALTLEVPRVPSPTVPK